MCNKQQPQFTGNLVEVGPSNQNNVSKGDLAYISCDPNSGTSNIDPTLVVETVGTILPQGIILYSLLAEECNLTGNFPSSTIYTMTSIQDSQAVLAAAMYAPSSFPVRTVQGRVASNATTSASGSPTADPDGGPAPTTAVAMSILYSITGIITLLFLAIIATGAIRAHRHPERYGPRTGLPGRPRQSRAKGLARAMLETLPIVKFGDPEPVKPGSRDIELEEGNTTVHDTTQAVAVPAITTTENEKARPVETNVADVESGLGPAQAESIKSGPDPAKKEGELGCSICTEDFTTGEDVRVLPCHHKYHPACIDPWLLNVSGTCPLWYAHLLPLHTPLLIPTQPPRPPPRNISNRRPKLSHRRRIRTTTSTQRRRRRRARSRG